MAQAMWFFEPMPPSRFVIQEHLRQTYWRVGLSTLWIEVTNPTTPYRAEGYWGDVRLSLEWVTASALTLRLSQDAEPVVRFTSLLLGFRPLARYQENGQVVYEWRARERAARLDTLRASEGVSELVALA